jgi:hypothetical protein
MTAPPERVEIQVPAEQVIVGDLLAEHDDEHVERLIVDATPDYVYAFTPEQRPLVRSTLVRVRRDATLVPGQYAPTPVKPATRDEVEDVRTLALQLADALTGKPTAAGNAAIAAQADKVRKGRKP